jgi:hypothetical protein
MFTLPVLPMRIHSFRLLLLVRKRRDDPLESLARKVPRRSCPNLPYEAAPRTCSWAVVPLVTITVSPFTCSAANGLFVPMPTFPLTSKIADGTRLDAASNFATKSSVSIAPAVAAVFAALLAVAAFGFNVPDVAFNVVAGLEPGPGPAVALVLPVAVVVVAGLEPGSLDVLASTNADAGIPPSVSASAAFNAYGTLTSNTRGACWISGPSTPSHLPALSSRTRPASWDRGEGSAFLACPESR